MRSRVWIPYLVGVLLLALCVNLGFWQLRRHTEKQVLQQRFEAAGTPLLVSKCDDLLPWQRAELRGVWRTEGTVFIDNHSYRGRPGYFVLTPLVLENNGGAVMVNRGWVATGPDRQKLPQPATPTVPVSLSGLALEPVQGGYSLGESASQPRVWQRIDPLRFKNLVPGPVAALVLQQEGGPDDGLVRDWPRPDFGIEKHLGYAMQWFSFAVVIAGLMMWFAWRSLARRKEVVA